MSTLAARTLAFAVKVPAVVLVLVPCLIVVVGRGRASFAGGAWWVSAIGVLLIALGTLVMGSCWVTFVLQGSGTPADYDPPTQLVKSRLYGSVRNPMFLAAVAIVLGEALTFRTLLLLAYAGLVGLWFHLMVVFHEEPSLRQRFGPAYDRYASRVPRWLPKLR